MDFLLPMATDTEIGKLTKLVEKGFTAVQDDFSSLRTDMEKGFEAVDKELSSFRADVAERFAAVDRRFDTLEAQMSDIKDEVRDIRKRLEVLERKVGHVTGYAKEIDHVLARVAVIEKHLGIA